MTDTLLIFRGLPGSGKSTFAKAWVAEDPEYRARVNRDDMRKLLHTEHAGRHTEAATTTAGHAAIRALLRSGRDVVVDDTNLNARHVKRLLLIAAQTGARVAWRDFPITVDEAIARDAQRPVDSRVGRDVIEKFARYLGPGGALPERPTLPPEQAAPLHEPYTGTPGEPPAVIVDIDGTLAHNDGHRSFYDYGEAILADGTHAPIVKLVELLMTGGYTPVIMSGRDDSCRDDTIKWLAGSCGLYPGDYVGPIMRATGDRRDDAIVKLELFDAEVRDFFDVRYVLDDRNRVVKAWRSIGLTCLQVADGDF